MAVNRLHLDFNIISSDDRRDFVKAYLDPTLKGWEGHYYVDTYNTDKAPFPFPYTPTAEELETIANYILYGKSRSNKQFDLKDKKGNDGTQSVVDAKYIEIPTRNSPWQRKQEESLNSMMDIAGETGNPIETQYNLIGGLDGKTSNERPRYKVPKETFSREECRHALCPDIYDENGKVSFNDDIPLCSEEYSNFTLKIGDNNEVCIMYLLLDKSRNNPFLLEQYESLWSSIDVMEYTITSYELRVGKRKLPIREELENRLTEEQKEKAYEHCTHLNMYTWSKLRKYLVELRQQQYMLRDSYASTLMHHSQMKYTESNSGALQFTSILPCGTLNKENNFNNQLFMQTIGEEHFSPLFQKNLINFLLIQDKEIESTETYGIFDFRNLDHVALLIYAQAELQPEEDNATALEENEYLQHFLDTLNYYISVAKLEELHYDIIKMKTAGSKNEDIATYINKTYNKTYSANYISTIFRSKCCGGIAEAAEQHWAIVDKLTAGKEEFKQCNTCGKTLLRDANNFVRKTRSNDGLAGRCKMCDKIARQAKKTGGK